MGLSVYKIAICLAVFVTDEFTWAEYVLIQNTTLETKYENNIGWKLPRDTIPRWFEYYNSTTHFINAEENIRSCASVLQDFVSLAESDGIWVACQDPELPIDCHVIPESCYPVLTYGNDYWGQMRTIKMKFSLFGNAIFRLNISRICFDYTYLNYPGLPSCEFMRITPEMESDGWIHIQFSFDPQSNTSFTIFSVEMIALSPQDVVVLDKIEATEYLLCGPDSQCTTTLPPPTTFFPTTEKPDKGLPIRPDCRG